MSDIKLKRIILGRLSTNCYIVYRESTKEGFIVDPADNVRNITVELTRLGVQPKGILLTHGHFDHIGAVNDLIDEYGIKVYMHEDESDVAGDAQLNASSMFGNRFVVKADVCLKDNEELIIAGINVKVIHTPGHTKGSCCYYVEEDKMLLSGDTLFYASHGRTDFPTGSERAIRDSILNKLMLLEGDTKVYPGHNEYTTIADEKKWY